MIVSTLKQAGNTMRASVHNEENKHAAETFTKLVNSLNQKTSELEPLLNIIKAMQAEGMANGAFSSSTKDTLHKAVEACRQKINDHLLGEGTLDEGTVSALENSIKLCRTNAQNAWKAAAKLLAEDVEKSLYSLSSILPNKERALALRQNLSAATKFIPCSPEDISDFKANVREGKAIVNSLHFDSEAESFIQKVTNNTATVSDLTQHIIEWISQNNLNRQFKIRF